MLALGRGAGAGHPSARRSPRWPLLLVTDEEWRVEPFRHVERFAVFDACLCFEGGQLAGDGEEGVVVQRKAAGTMRVAASGRAAHSGSAPDQGRNALLALASTAIELSKRHDPGGTERLSVVPTVVRSGDAFNVVPADGRAAVRHAGGPQRVVRGGVRGRPA